MELGVECWVMISNFPEIREVQPLSKFWRKMGRPSRRRQFLQQWSVAILTAAAMPMALHAGGDEGMVAKQTVLVQTNVGPISTSDPSYEFFASIRNSMSNHSGSVLAPSGATISPNPFDVVASPNLIGAHFVFSRSYVSQPRLNSAFPEGAYTFDIQRIYGDATTSFTQTVQFNGGAIPSVYPQIINSQWVDGALWLHPSDARVFYTAASGVGFSWGVVGGSGSGGGSSSGASGLLDLTGMLNFGQTLSAEFRFNITESASSITDPNAPNNAYQKESTYSALKRSVVRFTIKTPQAPANFRILHATYVSASQSWDVAAMLSGKIVSNGILYRMDEWELTQGSPTGQNGTLNVTYQNAEGVFEASIPFTRFSWDNYAILPSPSDSALPVPYSAWAQRFFSTAELSDLSLWGHNEDPDGDGRSNLKEFAFGLNPRASEFSDLSEPKAGIHVDVHGSRFLSISYRRSLGADVLFSLQQSTNLVSWASFSGVETTEDIDGEPNVKKVTVRSSTPVEWFGRQFLRVLVTDTNPPPQPPSLAIIEATYGASGAFNDVRAVIEANIVNEAVSLQVDNSTMGGDPIFGTPKVLFIRYTYLGQEFTRTVPEGGVLTLP
jgi:hypothetical protein